MCEICKAIPCLRGCPNEEEPKAVKCCTWCHSLICEGEEYITFEGEDICMECIDELSSREIFAMFGVEPKEAYAPEEFI